MKKYFIIIFIVLFTVLAFLYFYSQPKVSEINSFTDCMAAGNPVMESYPRQCNANGETFREDIGNELEKDDLIRISEPRPNAQITSPVTVKGFARGNWFFEGDFPMMVVDWDGKIIGTGYATAEGGWMTTEFVPFSGTIAFDKTQIQGNYSNKGTLILQKDNPSGLSEHDDALEIPIVFK